jgi:phage repressor protein C with HTH and peptisase S24 domain
MEVLRRLAMIGSVLEMDPTPAIPTGTERTHVLARRWTPVLVHGPSMVPTLRHGDAVLVRRGARIRPGDVVVGAFRARPDMLVVKRAVHEADGGWWLESDNSAVTDDSRRYGSADAYGRVVFRYWPPGRLGRVTSSTSRRRP